jgi:hypothetical protein
MSLNVPSNVTEWAPSIDTCCGGVHLYVCHCCSSCVMQTTEIFLLVQKTLLTNTKTLWKTAQHKLEPRKQKTMSEKNQQQQDQRTQREKQESKNLVKKRGVKIYVVYTLTILPNLHLFWMCFRFMR